MPFIASTCGAIGIAPYALALPISDFITIPINNAATDAPTSIGNTQPNKATATTGKIMRSGSIDRGLNLTRNGSNNHGIQVHHQ